MRLTAAAPPARVLSDGERRTLRAVAEAVMPAGDLFPVAGERAVERMESFLVGAGPTARSGYRALLHAVDALSWATHLRPLARLAASERLGLLEALRHGDYARRTLCKALVAPLKLSHFNDPTLFRQLGCAWGTQPSATAERPRWMRERVLSPVELDGETLECDVVVIGTGAGGAVVAKELAEQGAAVLLLEEGDYHTRADFTGHAVEMQRKLFRDMGATFSVGNVAIPIPIGKGVGGTTTVNSGTCYRAPDRVLNEFVARGLTDLSPGAMDPYYARVEEVLGVAEARAEYLGGVARMIGKGCDALGYAHRPLRRNAPECDGQGVCVFGCPTDAKRSTNVSYVPLALRAGAQLVPGVRAERVLVESGRAVGVAARRGEVRFTVRARAVVVACGALLTPVFLLEQGLANRSGELGRNLSIHPATGAFALFDERIAGWESIPQGYSIEEFHDEGILFEGAFAPLDVGAATIPLLGPRLMEVMEAFDRLACFGFLIEDTSRGRVRRGPGGRPLITYVLNDHDVARLKRGIAILARVYFAAGARTVLPNVHGFDELHGPADLERFERASVTARDFDLSAYHPLGTARMGVDPARSVVGPDHQSHDVPGLYVVDGSAVPSSLAVNPQLTIMAMATRAADGLARRLS